MVRRPLRPDVQRWLRRRTYTASTWSAADLAVARRDRGTTVSVVLPALDEEPTVGAIVRAIREALVEDAPLVDEVVVVDSGSADRTAAVAAAAGARVVDTTTVLPGNGRVPG